MKRFSKDQKPASTWWRTLLASIFVAIAAVALIGAVTARYIRDNVLNTDGYIAIIGPLPQDPAVAEALATYTTEKIFDAAGATNVIKDTLPPKLAPLAAPLSDTLEEKLAETTKEFVQGDTFNSIWTSANRTTHQAVMRVAESKEGEGRLGALGTLDLDGLFAKIRERFGDRTLLTDQQKDKAAALQVNLHQSVEQLRLSVRVIKASARTLPFVCLAFLLLAVAIAANRRRVVMGIGVLLVVMGASFIIGFKVMSGNLLTDITNPIYRGAADVMYQAFYSDLHRRLALVMSSGLVLFVLALLAGPYDWARSFRRTIGLERLGRTAFCDWMSGTRDFTASYKIWFALAGVILFFAALLLVPTLTTGALVIAISLLISYLALIQLIARR